MACKQKAAALSISILLAMAVGCTPPSDDETIDGCETCDPRADILAQLGVERVPQTLATCSLDEEYREVLCVFDGMADASGGMWIDEILLRKSFEMGDTVTYPIPDDLQLDDPFTIQIRGNIDHLQWNIEFHELAEVTISKLESESVSITTNYELWGFAALSDTPYVTEEVMIDHNLFGQTYFEEIEIGGGPSAIALFDILAYPGRGVDQFRVWVPGLSPGDNFIHFDPTGPMAIVIDTQLGTVREATNEDLQIK